MKDEPITASLPISSGRGTSPGLSPCATAAEPTRQCPVSPADFVRGGAADDGHQMARRTPDNMLFTTFQSQAQNKVGALNTVQFCSLYISPSFGVAICFASIIFNYDVNCILQSHVIGEVIGCSGQSVAQACRRFGIWLGLAVAALVS